MFNTPYYKVLLLIGGLALVGAGCRGAVTTQTGSPAPRPITPERGTSIMMQNCVPEPRLLQVTAGTTEVVFENKDDTPHTLFVEGKETVLPAKGKVTVKPEIPPAFVGTDFTSNYLCDGQSSGAIYFPAR